MAGRNNITAYSLQRDMTELNIIHWAVWFTVEGDLRFLSHRNMMSLCERSAARAKLPIRFSEGFNPRPKLSLPLPRPVGVTSQCELLIIGLEQDSPPQSESDLARRLGEQFPDGMELIKVEPLPDKTRAKIKAVTYELAMADSEQKRVKARLASLKQSPKWEVPRRRSHAGDKPAKAEEFVDIKGQIGNIGISRGLRNEGRLSFTLEPTGAAGPIGPKQVLPLLGLTDVTEALSELKKTTMECIF
ncbi:MAG: TIGR03936 family radical SAM-associated protein [Phycisphaerae bacterium]|nr:TIGR03936 family radical SAM-associated protein [Phycisphaerae bacterium]